MNEDSLLSFPCELPIKVFGRNVPELESTVRAIVRSHHLHDEDIRQRSSRGGNYLSLTVTVRVESRAQADAVYEELTSVDEILMVL